MNKKMLVPGVAAAAFLAVSALAVIGLAKSGHVHNAHDGHRGSKARGTLIREAHLCGYHVTYHLMDMRNGIKGPHAAETPSSHHLMLRLTDADGNPARSARILLVVKGPHGPAQEVMASAMGDGYGADVVMGCAGNYSIQSKAVVGGTSFSDAFSVDLK